MSENNSDLSGILQRVLGDPEAMQKILKLAGEMKGGDKEHGESEENIAAPQPKENTERRGEGQGEGRGDEKREKKEAGEAEENRIRLLCALKPYLNEERRDRADVMIRILRLLRFTDLNELTKLLGGIIK